ncbi:hypothetical protein LBMAG38_19690 [Chloroflexota bacterium]|nr:hypothetical protein LBMAG38_19690 [Chloroflexota bacterium]
MFRSNFCFAIDLVSSAPSGARQKAFARNTPHMAYARSEVSAIITVKPTDRRKPAARRA